MGAFLTILFCLSLVASVYFLLRLIISLIIKQPIIAYKKKLSISAIILIISLIGISTIPKSSEQLAAKREKFGIEKPKSDGTIYEQRFSEEKVSKQEKEFPKELTPEEKVAKEAEEKASEEKRIAEQQVIAEKKAQEEAHRQAEQEERIIAEKYAFQDWESKINSGINAVDDHWESLWQYTLNSASSGAIDAQTVFQNFRELEHKLIDDEMIFQNATVPQEMSQAYSKKMNTIRQNFVSWAKLRRKSCENFRLAFMQGNITPQVMQESIDIINQADAFMLRSTAQLVELENEINNR